MARKGSDSKVEETQKEFQVKFLNERLQILKAAKKDTEATQRAIVRGEEILKMMKEKYSKFAPSPDQGQIMWLTSVRRASIFLYEQ